MPRPLVMECISESGLLRWCDKCPHGTTEFCNAVAAEASSIARDQLQDVIDEHWWEEFVIEMEEEALNDLDGDDVGGVQRGACPGEMVGHP